ncbi:TolC family protein [Rubripirellula reticaptiva]|uniref:TolC family protein n=1 Tax=Rubripirellula reticaptiva TaxID=2528013 RepID=UPI001FE893A0|nr:TolC family protein [Rubripirellula reticaptiva]
MTSELLEQVKPELVDAVRIDTPTDLQSLIEKALALHPEIMAARQRVAALQNRIPQATALADPVFGNTFHPIHDQAVQTAAGRIGHQLALSQNIPWPEKLDARGAVAARDVQVARAEVARAERDVVESVRVAYYELWLAGRMIQIVDENRELVDDLIDVAEARYKTGGSQQDVIRAQLEQDRLEDRLIALRRSKDQSRADLGVLVRQPVDLTPTAMTELDVSQVMPDLHLLVAQAEQCNPKLQGLAAEIQRDAAKQRLAYLQNYPDFQLGVGYSIVSNDSSVISPVADGHDAISFSVAVTLPIWRDKINGGINETIHQRNSSINRREAERDRLRGLLRRQVAAAQAANEQLDLFTERVIPRTEKALQIAFVEYVGDKTEYSDVIDLYRELLSHEIQVARTRAVLASTLAQIERAVGCSTDGVQVPQ